jgi:hypothetical protein
MVFLRRKIWFVDLLRQLLLSRVISSLALCSRAHVSYIQFKVVEFPILLRCEAILGVFMLYGLNLLCFVICLRAGLCLC